MSIELERVTFTYHGQPEPALRELTLTLRPGEAAAVVGPSGSGKSTLLYACNGLVPHSLPGRLEGRVRVAGQGTRELTVAQLATRVGLVFQDPEDQFAMLGVEDEVAFGPENLALPAGEIARHVERALDQVGIAHLRQARLDELSGGERQKVALAAVLAMGVRRLLLDGPTAHLDPASVWELVELLGQLKSGGTSLLIADHRLEPYLQLLDRIFVLDHSGRLRFEGTPQELAAAGEGIRLEELGIWIPPSWQPPGVSTAAPSLRRGAPEGREAALETSGLSFTYPGSGRLALEAAELRVASGGLFALAGANGAGKSTLAHCAAGVLPVPEGRVRVFGRDVARLKLPELVREVGYVFQSPDHQFVTQQVEEELAFTLRVRGLPAAEIRSRVQETLASFRLAGLAGRHPLSLSLGQKRRLSVACILIGRPRLLILDEPTLGLDRQAAEELMELAAGAGREGTTVLLISHDLDLIRRHAHQMAVMAGGRILRQGPTAELLEDGELLASARLAPARRAADRVPYPGRAGC